MRGVFLDFSREICAIELLPDYIKSTRRIIPTTSMSHFSEEKSLLRVIPDTPDMSCFSHFFRDARNGSGTDVSGADTSAEMFLVVA